MTRSPPGNDALEQEQRVLRDAEIDLVDVAAPQRLAEAVEKKVMPSVAMNRMIPSWLTSGRSTRRSIAKASAT